jgi:hypothetical protein
MPGGSAQQVALGNQGCFLHRIVRVKPSAQKYWQGTLVHQSTDDEGGAMLAVSPESFS